MEQMTQTCISFRFLGQVDGNYVVRAPTWKTSRRNGFDVHSSVSAAQSWLLSNVALSDHHAGNGNVRDYPTLPGAFSNGNAFVICFHKLEDMLKFSQRFSVNDIELATLH